VSLEDTNYPLEREEVRGGAASQRRRKPVATTPTSSLRIEMTCATAPADLERREAELAALLARLFLGA
jgi:hypothetical protein